MHNAYQKFAKHYDLIFSKKDYEKETNFIKQIVKDHSTQIKSILDVGCGTGKHLSFLSNTFDQLTGVDLNEEIINIAKTNHPNIDFATGEMQTFNLRKKFNVITCLYSVFNYNLSIQSANKTLQNFKQHLEKDGLLIIAFYNPQNTEKKLTIHMGKDESIEIAKFNQYKYNAETKMEEAEFLILSKDKNGVVDFTIEKDHQYRIFSLEEISELIVGNGFKEIKIYDNFSSYIATNTSIYPVAVAKNI